MTAAASIFPTSQLLRAIRKNPGYVHELLRFSTEAIKLISRDFFRIGAVFTLCDPVASGTILRKDDYMEFVYPYTREKVKLHCVIPLKRLIEIFTESKAANQMLA